MKVERLRTHLDHLTNLLPTHTQILLRHLAHLDPDQRHIMSPCPSRQWIRLPQWLLLQVHQCLQLEPLDKWEIPDCRQGATVQDLALRVDQVDQRGTCRYAKVVWRREHCMLRDRFWYQPKTSERSLMG